MTEDMLLQLMVEVERADPIDYANLPFDDDALRALACKLIAERSTELELSGMSQEALLATLWASTAKLVLENIVLNARLLTLQGLPDDAKALIDRIARQSRGGA
ncbi:hypothetical protein D3C87_1123030 [compost metagenome]|jgi:hypothetical protein|uniref:Uncharacterized protein n=1 Tax=Cupriavidus campinensis TaxID=151783 RepID=A0AAE9L3F4_9BURK|nr:MULTISPECIES: hypothetical protein [Cupriavidus]TSP10261.1 hypothetical protein FGG12_23895 [Cupriavidus campinensis]URF05025.1 hypothetical protein M5D45_04090 [Cupriavidus campinensis]CAG2132298.1 hypothetical protein LMG19282_00582 [Cupriavidus campinensis]SFC03933.1 hypothetical protein SAMN05216321_102563 [Cupriavidus sp. OV038]SFO88217.1 hypothetical protein SAMN05216322_10353 [Cupriavidus sp. OV096]